VEPPTGHGSLSPKKVPDDAPNPPARCRGAVQTGKTGGPLGSGAALTNVVVGASRSGRHGSPKRGVCCRAAVFL